MITRQLGKATPLLSAQCRLEAIGLQSLPPLATQAEGVPLDDTAAAEPVYSAEDQAQLHQRLAHWLTGADVSLSGCVIQGHPFCLSC